MMKFSKGLRALVGACALAALAACSGSGGGDGGSGGGSSSGGGYLLFATDLNTGTIAAFTTLDPVPGQVLAAHIVKTDEGGTGITYDAVHDDLYAIRTRINQPAATIDVFAHASRMTKDAAPTRTILVSGLSDLRNQILIDTTRDELWVSGYGDTTSNFPGRVTTIAHASTQNGSVTPSRDITALPNFATFALDRKRSVLYLAGGGGTVHGVYVYDNVATLVSGMAPTRTIDALEGLGTGTIALDEQRDILYVPDVFSGLNILRDASTGSNAVATVACPTDTPCQVAAVDSVNDRLYIGAYTSAFVFDHASTLTTGSVVPGAAVQAQGASIFSFAFGQ